VGAARVVGGASPGVAAVEGGTGGLGRGPGGADPADAGEAPDDLAGAGRGERVLVVDARVRDPDHELAAVEIVERQLLEAPHGLLFHLADAVGLELVHRWRIIPGAM